MSWLDNYSTTNTFRSMYIDGFMDISGGRLQTRSSTNGHLMIAGDTSLNGNLYVSGDISWNPNNLANNCIPSSAVIGGSGGGGGGDSVWDITGNNIYYNSGNVGIGTTSPTDKLTITDGNLVLTNGKLKAGNLEGNYAWHNYGQIISGNYESDNAIYFGISVGMDVSGLTIVVGIPGQEGANTGASNDGSVIVYRYNTSTELWYQLGNTITGESNNYDFGFNVDINDAGSRILATNHTTGDFVNVYDYNSVTNNWDINISITTHTIGSYGGRISGDGNTILFSDYTVNSSTGKQYIYRNTTGTTWSLIGEFTGTHSSLFSGIGSSISYDGNRITFNEKDYDYDAYGNPSTERGRVTIYDYYGSGTTWIPIGSSLYGEASADKFSNATDFSKDGTIIALGTREGNYVKVFEYDVNVDGSWNQLGTTIRGPTSNLFGDCVRLSDDGTILLVNDSENDRENTNNGSLYVFKYTNGNWEQQGNTLYGAYTGAQLGSVFNGGIAISGDGSKIVAGGYLADVNTTDSGYIHAWQWSKKTYNNYSLDVSGRTVTMWGNAENEPAYYSISQFGLDIDEETGGERSNTLSFSNDGTILYIGHQLGYNEYGERTGSFRVMRYQYGEWYKIGSTIAPRSSEVGVFQGTLGNTYYNGGNISSDGTRALGCWRNEDTDSSTKRKGLIRVYDLSGANWVQIGNDIEGDSPGDLITSAIMSGDGNTIAYRDIALTYAKILTYNSSTNTWVVQTTISSSGIFIRNFSYDGTIRIDQDTSTSGNYHIKTYKYSNNSWYQIGQTLASYEVANDEAFNVVSLSQHGEYLLLGDQDSNGSKGVAIVLKYNSENDKWMQIGGNIQNPFTTEIYYITAGGISADGKTIVVTDYLSRGLNVVSNAGAFAVYKLLNGNWRQIYLYEHDIYNEALGTAAAMCDSGDLFAIPSSSGSGYYVKTYQITNNPALKIENDVVTMSGTMSMNGKVGIGTSNPSYNLHVNGSFNAKKSYFERNTGDWTTMYIGSGTTSTRLYLRDFSNSNNVTIYAYSSSFSDDRLKTNEEFITGATDTLMKLSVQKYKKYENFELTGNYKEETGLIAQDIWYNAPELRHIVDLGTDSSGNKVEPLPLPEGINTLQDIQTDPDYNALGWGNNEAGVLYAQLIPYLIKSNQEQQERIVKLETQVANLINQSNT